MSDNNETAKTPPTKVSKKGKKSDSTTGTFRSHHSFLDPQKVYKPKVTLTILTLVTLIAMGSGWFFITHWKFGEILTDRPVRARYVEGAKYGTVLHAELKEPGMTALAGGWDDLFHVAYEKKIVQYRMVRSEEGIGVEKVWSRDFSETPTAMHFVSLNDSIRKGDLLVAFKNRIEVITPSQTEGEGLPLVTFEEEGTHLTGITCDEQSIFAADLGRGTIRRCNLLGEKLPDIGTASDETSFPGFRLDDSTFFDLDYSPKHKKVYAANPTAFRIEAFSATTGQWQSDGSWEKYPGSRTGFFGPRNPAVLRILPSGTILTIEAGKTPRIRNFDTEGKLLAELVSDDESSPAAADKKISSLLAAVGRSADGKNHLLVLSESGRLELYQEP